jgi:serine/threonine protein kinase/Tfp pilus assembly protein PilF
MRRTVAALRTDQRSSGQDKSRKQPPSRTSTFLGMSWQSIACQIRSLYETVLDHGSQGCAASPSQSETVNVTLPCDANASSAHPERERDGAEELIPQAGAQSGDQAQPGPAPPTLVHGLMVDGRYLIEKELNRGGFCVVYLARDRKLHDTPVVIKVLQEHVMEYEGDSRAWLVHRFKEEVQALARIDHPGVVRALDIGLLPDGRTFLVMQHVAGTSLRSAIPTHGMDLRRAARLIQQIGRALEAAHKQGVIHRDIKPENIMLQRVGDEEFAKLIDFGIATVLDAPMRSSIKSTRVAGTIDYMAPEQFEGRPTVASDIYALGVISYEMVTGRRPFNPDHPHQLRDLQQAGVRIKPCDLRPGLPKAAQAVILRALSFASQARYASAQDFCQALNLALMDRAIRGPQPAGTSIPLGSFLSALFFTITVCLTLVISRRFLTNTPDIYGFSVSFALGVLCLSLGSIFTQSGQHWIERRFPRIDAGTRSFGRWRAAFTLVGLLVVGALYLALPSIARVYNNKRAVQFHQTGDLPAAIRNYERAISLDPGYAVAHYNLASVYEDVLDFEKAVGEYRVALRLDPKFYFAYNNLAHLYLAYRKDFPSALKIANDAIALGPEEPEVNYTVYTNRGWAHFGLGLYDLAIDDLTKAIHWREDGAAAHCLLAQVLEKQRKENAALQEWEKCVADAPGEKNVEASWLSVAQERVRQAGEK